MRRRAREKMAVACGVITRRQFVGYFAERRRFLRQRSAAWRRRGRAGRGARHRHAPPSFAGPAVAVHRVELQRPLERGARHGATAAAAVGGGAAFSSLPCVSSCATDTQSATRTVALLPGGREGRGTGATRRRLHGRPRGERVVWVCVRLSRDVTIRRRSWGSVILTGRGREFS